MKEIRYQHVDLPALIAQRELEREARKVTHRPRKSDMVEFEADDHVEQVTLPSEVSL